MKLKKIILLAALVALSGAMFAQTQHITKADFLKKVFNYETSTEWKYLGEKPCIIDFYATWCGPCKRLAPILEELSTEYGGQIVVYKVDAEQERELAALFRVRSYPTIVFCPKEGAPQIALGLQPKEQLRIWIDQILLPKTTPAREETPAQVKAKE